MAELPTSIDDDTTTITVRGVDSRAKRALRIRAARHGHSMQAELRLILTQIAAEELAGENETHLVDAIDAIFGAQRGVELNLPPRTEFRNPPSFD